MLIFNFLNVSTFNPTIWDEVIFLNLFGFSAFGVSYPHRTKLEERAFLVGFEPTTTRLGGERSYPFEL